LDGDTRARVDALRRPAVAHHHMARFEQLVRKHGELVETDSLDGDRPKDLEQVAGTRRVHAAILQ
jgi:hypothetical protein